MRVLVISYESWRETNNGGNVLTNIFQSFNDVEIAQVYCSGGKPQNSICKRYFQISDSMLLSKNKGRRLEERDYSTNEDADEIENRINQKIPAAFKSLSLLVRELLWTVFDWKTQDLECFVKGFKPDLIFAPCYSYSHVSKLALYIKSLSNCPLVSYISDDNYSIRQLRFSPSFWINRIITRKWIKRLFSEASLVYTMTELQKEEYEQIFNRPMKILCKSASFDGFHREVNSPLRLIYAGGLYLKRWKVLYGLAEAIKKINQTDIKCQLDIYSSSAINERVKKKIHDGKSIFLHKAIPYKQLMEKYHSSDVAIHVESFDLKYRLTTRLSFSTKIIDCMNSGCAILAIGPKTQAGISYLYNNDAAICVFRMESINEALLNIVDHPDVVIRYAQNAYELGINKHNRDEIEKELQNDFRRIIHEYRYSK